MDLRSLVQALIDGDALRARQLTADAMRNATSWAEVPRPIGCGPVELAVSAGIVELLASRANQSPPSWTEAVGHSPTPIYLTRAALTMPRLRRACEAEGPEPLRRRRIFAPPEFLTMA